MSKLNDIPLILNEIKSYYKFKTNLDFASFLGIAPQTLSSWYARNTIDYDLIYSKCVDIDGNWLLSGRGNMLKAKIDLNSHPASINDLITLLNEKDDKIELLNREIGGLQYSLSEMKKKFKRLKKGEYSTKTIPHSSAAEDDLKYIQNKKGNTHTHKTR